MPGALLLDNPMDGGSMQVDLTDVDDLFGDGVPLAPLSRPPSKRLLLRLDELRSRGSCQGLAWSKSGTIASIAPDGQSLKLQYLRARPKDAAWTLSDPTDYRSWQSLSGGPIVHLSWAPTTTSDLAVIDATGRVMILRFDLHLNHPGPTLARSWENDPVDDSHAVVGTHWLNPYPQRNMLILYAPAVKNPNGSNYAYESSPVISNGPYHPNPSRSAFFCVTAHGVLKMFWSHHNGKFEKIEENTLELESVTSADDLITHAAICSDSRAKCLFVALATSSKQLQLVQVQMSWVSPQQENGKAQAQGNQATNPTSVTLRSRHIAIDSWLPGGPIDSHLDSSMTHLSHIEILPIAFDQASKTWKSPVILTVRSFVPTPDTPYSHDVQSIIDRWEITLEQSPTLHPAFEQLGSKKNNSGSSDVPNTPRLKRLEPIIVNKIIIDVAIIRMGTAVCLSYSDGTVEYRDRSNMNVLWQEANLDRINTIQEAGFTQGGEASCLQTAVSLTTCSIVQMGEDGKLKWHGINYTLGDPASLSDGQYSAAIAALTISTAQAMVSGASIDDIIAAARPFTSKERFCADWISEVIRMLKIAVDYSEEAHHDKLMRNGLLQMCLSILNHLGWKGDYQPRSFSGKMSMFALSLRNIVILTTIASNSYGGKDNNKTPLDDPEVVDALTGCCKWATDLLCWLTDSLFCLAQDRDFRKFMSAQTSFADLISHLAEKKEIALHMVLSSTTRGLLSAVCRRMQHLHGISQRAMTFYQARSHMAPNNPNASPSSKAYNNGNGSSPQVFEAYSKILRYTSCFKAEEFDEILTAFGRDIRKKYVESFAELSKRATAAAEQARAQNPNASQKSNLGEEAVNRAIAHCESAILLGGAPPSTFFELVKKFFDQDLATFRTHCDPAELYFKNYDLLEVNDDPRELNARRRRGVKVDLFKRVEIFKPHKDSLAQGSAETDEATLPLWRRCVRCASVMEDIPIDPAKRGFNFVLQQQGRCMCGGKLALLSREEMAE